MNPGAMGMDARVNGGEHMNDRDEKERRLATLKAELMSVEGTPTEVYSRIVGYYRSVRNWNPGKRAEYVVRKTYDLSGFDGTAPCADPAEGNPAGVRGVSDAMAAGFTLFSRKACPNCPPVKSWLADSGIEGREIDVDIEEGLELARRNGVLASPTVIFTDVAGAEMGRAHSVSELKSFVRPGAERVFV